MKLKHLEAALQDMEIFEQPKVHLEQYPTTPHLAACVLYEAHNKFDDIQDRAVLDLGCGTCMLSTAAKILGAGYVCGVDVDGDALEIAQRNMEAMEVEIDLVQCDIARLAIPLSRQQWLSSAANDLTSDFTSRQESPRAQFEDAASKDAREQLEDTHDEGEIPTEKQYQCEFDCGFIGSYDDVCMHERSCSFALEEGLGNEESEDAAVEDDRHEKKESSPEEDQDFKEDGGQRGPLVRAGLAEGRDDNDRRLARTYGSARSRRFDTVLMNPPFGTRCKGMDLLFLYTGLCCARRAVYSMHKTSTRDGIAKRVGKWGVTYQVIAELKFDLPASYDFHKKKNVVIEVDLVRLEIPKRWHTCSAETDADMLDLVTGLHDLALQVGSNADVAHGGEDESSGRGHGGPPSSGGADAKRGSEAAMGRSGRGRGGRRGRR